MSITPKNWNTFQHYKDRSPAWIKLHRGLLDNRDYHLLTPLAAKCLPLIWLIASEKDGIIPNAAELAFRLRVSETEAGEILDELITRDFIVNRDEAEPAEHGATLAQRTAASNGFGSRHISDKVKREVWARDGAKCCQCGSTERIEYDHKHPVSKGGNSDADNIQLLCRPCNRSKRVSVATPAQPPRSPEKRDIENIEKTEEEKKGRSQSSRGVSLPHDWQPSDDDFAYGLNLGLAPGQVSAAAEDMRLWARANSNRSIGRKADWSSTFKGWMRRNKQEKPNGIRQDERTRSQDDFRAALRELGDYARGGGPSAEVIQLLPAAGRGRPSVAAVGGNSDDADVPD